MTPDWNAIRLDLLDIDAPMRTTLREMRPFFAKALPGILARFYDKVRQHDPSSAIFQNGAMQEAIRLQLQHWDLIGAAEFSLPYFSSVAGLSEFHQRAGVAPQWYVGCRLMFIADQLMKAVETEVELPRDERAARDKRTLMQNAIAKAVMLDTENVVAVYFGSNRQSRKNAIADGKISEITSAISPAIEKQSAATQEVSGNIQRTAAGTLQVAGTIAEISHGANRTGAASNQSPSSANQLSDSTASLQVEIDVLKSIAAAA